MSEKDERDRQHDRHEQHLHGGANAKGVGGWLLHRAKPYLPVWVGAAGVGVAGCAASLQWHGSVGGGVGLTLASVGITASSWLVTRGLELSRRIHITVTTGLASTWITAAALAGPAAGVLPSFYLMGAPVVAVSWNIRQITGRLSPAGASGDSNGSLLEKVGLARTRLGAAKVEPNRVTVPYSLPAGELTNDDVSRALPRIASALDVPSTAVRFQPDPESARKGVFVIVPQDMLKDPSRWPGPSAPGGSIVVPLRIGVYDDGAALLLPLLDAIHLLVMGQTGSGKTEGALDVLLEILTRSDVCVWLSDAAKAGQDFMPLAPAFDWAAFDMVSTSAMVAAVQAAIPARARWLRDHSYRAWEERCAQPQTDPAHSCQAARACGCAGMPYLLAWFEEAAKILREMGEDTFTGIAQEARSAGVSLVVSMQRASGYQLSTDTRASLPGAMCFGVRGDDAAFALPEDVLDAGANPAAWGNKRKGYVYLVSAGVDEDLYANPARTFWTGPAAEYAQLAAWVVGTFAGVRAELDPVTAGAAERVAGEKFTGRRRIAGLGPVPQDAIPGQAVHSDDAEADDSTMGGLVDPEDAGADVTADLPIIADPIPLPKSDMTTEEIRALLAELVEQIASIGPGTVAVKDLYPYLEMLGRDRSWVSKEMKRLGETGRLAPTATEGVYRLLPVPAAA